MKKHSIFIVIMLCMLIGCSRPDEYVTDQRLIVFPPPAQVNVTIKVVHGGSPFNVKAFDNEGKLVLDQTQSASQEEASDFSLQLSGQGTYHVILEIENTTITQSFLGL